MLYVGTSQLSLSVFLSSFIISYSYTHTHTLSLTLFSCVGVQIMYWCVCVCGNSESERVVYNKNCVSVLWLWTFSCRSWLLTKMYLWKKWKDRLAMCCCLLTHQGIAMWKRSRFSTLSLSLSLSLSLHPLPLLTTIFLFFILHLSFVSLSESRSAIYKHFFSPKINI